MYENIPDPGWASSFFHTDSGDVYLSVKKVFSESQSFDELKEGRANILVAKKTKAGLKLIHIFNGSEAIKSFGSLEFKFPQRFIMYFNNFGIEPEKQRDYVLSIYPAAVDTMEFFDLMKYFHSLKKQNDVYKG